MIVLTYQDALVGLALIAAQGCFMLALMLYPHDLTTALPANLDMRSMRCSLDG